MEETSQTYRIEICAASKQRTLLLASLWVLYAASLAVWPYYLPTYVTVALVVSLAYLLWSRHNDLISQVPKHLSISEQGEVSLASQQQSIQLTAGSFVMPGWIYLRFDCSDSQLGGSLYLFSDMLREVDMIRLRRIVLRKRRTVSKI